MLLAGTAALTAGLGLRAGDASARYGNWDMESPAIGSCAIGDEGDECRRNLLMWVGRTFQSHCVHMRLECGANRTFRLAKDRAMCSGE